MNPIRVLIVDDHPVVRDGLRGMFSGEPGFEVAGEAVTAAKRSPCQSLQPDVILMDPHQRRWGERDPALAEQGSEDAFCINHRPGQLRSAHIEAARPATCSKMPRGAVAGCAVAQGETILSPSVAGRLVTRCAIHNRTL